MYELSFHFTVLFRLRCVAKVGFYCDLRRQASTKPDAEATARRDPRAFHASRQGTCGHPRLVLDLRDPGHTVGPNRVVRPMRDEGLRGRANGCWKPRTTDSAKLRPVATNHLGGRCEVTSAAPAWVIDITRIESRESLPYLKVVLSVQARQVLGYCVSVGRWTALSRARS